ncbi:MAG: hypothetical protein ABSB49_02720 [Polyangia bacterium]|jgi:hypothetical protein
MGQPPGRLAVAKPFLCLYWIAFASLVLASVPAFADGRQAQERTARKACLAGDYNRGVSILADLFVDTKDPTYIFNQGRCFEQNHRYEDAISRFEEYLRVPDAKLNAADRAAAEQHIADCKDRLPPEVSGKSQASVPSFVQPVPAAPPEPKSTPEASASVAVPSEKPEAPGSGSSLRVAGIVTASVGVAAVAAGVAFNIESNNIVNQFETSVSYSTSRNTDINTYKTMAWVGYGVGAACVVTGAILFGFGLRGGSSSPTKIAILPVAGPGQAGALLAGGF